jgi:hypothetical protein
MNETIQPAAPPAVPGQVRRGLARRVLGPTTGPAEGNVRAVIAVLLTLSVPLLYAFMLYLLVFREAEYLRDTVNQWAGGLLGLAVAVGAFYFGRRSAGG